MDIHIDEKTFNLLMFRMEMRTCKVKAFGERQGEKRLKMWYDNQDVCLRLNISLRTLQTLRTSGSLPYTQINRKMFYKPEDVENLIVNPIKDKTHEKQNDYTGG
jgi:hypothetical protein